MNDEAELFHKLSQRYTRLISVLLKEELFIRIAGIELEKHQNLTPQTRINQDSINIKCQLWINEFRPDFPIMGIISSRQSFITNIISTKENISQDNSNSITIDYFTQTFPLNSVNGVHEAYQAAIREMQITTLVYGFKTTSANKIENKQFIPFPYDVLSRVLNLYPFLARFCISTTFPRYEKKEFVCFLVSLSLYLLKNKRICQSNIWIISTFTPTSVSSISSHYPWDKNFKALPRHQR